MYRGLQIGHASSDMKSSPPAKPGGLLRGRPFVLKRKPPTRCVGLLDVGRFCEGSYSISLGGPVNTKQGCRPTLSKSRNCFSRERRTVKTPNRVEDMTMLLDRKIASTVALKNKINGKGDQTREGLLRLVVRRHADRLVVVGRIEFGAVAAPGGVLEYAVDLAKPGRRKPRRDDLSDPHHHIPADDLDAGRRKSFTITLLLELRVEFAQGARLVVLQEYGEHNGVVGCRRRVFRRRRGRLRQSA